MRCGEEYAYTNRPAADAGVGGGVDACAADQHVAAGTAVEHVIARSAIEHIGTATAAQLVRPAAAAEDIGAGAAGDGIIASAAGDPGGKAPDGDRVAVVAAAGQRQERKSTRLHTT